MSHLDSISPEAIVTACRNNAAQAAESLASCFGGQWSLLVPDAAGGMEGAAPAAEPGLVVVLKLAQGAAALVWPESTGLLPEWIRQTDTTARSKLSTLAQELGLLLLPDDLAAAEFAAGYVTDLAEVWQRGAFEPQGRTLPLTLTSAQRSGVATLAWLATEPNMLEAVPPSPPPPAAPRNSTSVALTPNGNSNLSFEESLADLPPYMRSLLRIKVQLTVSLATTRQPVRRIVELGPGSIIQFDKRCDDPLELCVDNQEIAVGEAVKVGEKFGVRLSSMVLPKERFLPLRK